MKKLLREPLVHFLIAGTMLFVIYGYTGRNDMAADARITVGSAQIQRIQAAWVNQWSRLPTGEELQNLIEQFIQEEVLYREALTLGLDKDDTIIRYRLVEKMRFLILDIADQKQPEDSELKVFFKENREHFKTPALISFTHVYFNPKSRGAASLKDAQQVLDSLKLSDLALSPEAGDRFMLGHNYFEMSQVEATRLFGIQFAEELFALRPGPWQGPIRSLYGIHLVHVKDYVPARVTNFSEVKDSVRWEYIDRQLREANEVAFKDLKSRYRIEVDEEAVKRFSPQTGYNGTSGDAS